MSALGLGKWLEIPSVGNTLDRALAQIESQTIHDYEEWIRLFAEREVNVGKAA